MTKRFTPAFFVAFFNVITFAVINGIQLVTQLPIRYVNKWIMPGVDYQDFYQASLQVLNGSSPYVVERYVTPPLFAFANIPFALLGFEIARVLFVLLIPFMVLVSCILVFRILNQSDLEENDWSVLSILLIILFSYPLYFLFERGNIDGVVLLCMCLGLYFLARKPWLGGLFLASAIHVKLYPILLLLPLFLARRWKPFLWTCAWIVILALVTVPYWNDFAALLSRRSNSFQLFENGSLVNTLLFIGMVFGNSFGRNELFWAYAPLYSALLFGLLLSVLIMADYKLSRADLTKQFMVNALLYFPFMVALPKSVYHYEFVVLLPLVPVLDYLWKRAVFPSERFVIWMIAIGVALSQWQAVALHMLTNNMIAYYIPGIGLLLVMIGIGAYKFMQLGKGIQNPALEQSSTLSTEDLVARSSE